MKRLLIVLSLITLINCNNSSTTANEEQVAAPLPQAVAVVAQSEVPMQMTEEEMMKNLEGSEFLVRISKIQAAYSDLDDSRSTSQIVDASMQIEYQEHTAKYVLGHSLFAIENHKLEDSKELPVLQNFSASRVVHLLNALDSELKFDFNLYGDDWGFDDVILENTVAVVPVREIVQAFGKSLDVKTFEKPLEFMGGKKYGKENSVMITIEFLRVSQEEYYAMLANTNSPVTSNEYEPISNYIGP